MELSAAANHVNCRRLLLHLLTLGRDEQRGEVTHKHDFCHQGAEDWSGRADLAAIYHERIDVEGHHYGPSSPQRKDALKAVDTVLQYMTKWIQVPRDPLVYGRASRAEMTQIRMIAQLSWQDGPDLYQTY
ncbi:hypothetical protein CB1_000998008 [Camelus ferus]|nr:hypothetical protein CB1_000998008 [Camelus ferus]